ncbi:unnamed protein product [Malus baccata var. baccata]
MKRKAPFVSFSQRRCLNPLIPSFSATPSLSLIRSSQAQEPTSSTHMGARMPIALQRQRGAETVALGDPAPSGQVLLHNLQSNAMKMFDGMPKRRIKDKMPNFLTLHLMEQFKSGLAINEFPFEEGGVLRELKILTETSIKIVSDQLTIVDITLLSPTFPNSLKQGKYRVPLQVMFKYMSSLAATYIISENQRHVCHIFHIDSIVLITAFDKHCDIKEFVTWGHFNATCKINLVAALFVSLMTHICLMESELPISISPYCKWLAAEFFKEKREIMIYDCLSITLKIVGKELQSPLQKMSKVVHIFSLIVSDQLDTTFMEKVDYGTPMEVFAICIYECGAIFQQEFSYVVRLFALRKLNLDFSSSKTVQIVGSRDIVTRQLNSCQQWLDDVAMWEISLAGSEVGAVAQKISPFKPITTIFVGTNDAFGMFEGYDLRQFFKTIMPGPSKLNGLLNGDAQEYVGDWQHKQEGVGVDTWNEITFNDDHVSNVSRSTVGNELTFVISVYKNGAISVSDTRSAKQFVGVIPFLGIGWLFKVITRIILSLSI